MDNQNIIILWFQGKCNFNILFYIDNFKDYIEISEKLRKNSAEKICIHLGWQVPNSAHFWHWNTSALNYPTLNTLKSTAVILSTFCMMQSWLKMQRTTTLKCSWPVFPKMCSGIFTFYKFLDDWELLIESIFYSDPSPWHDSTPD